MKTSYWVTRTQNMVWKYEWEERVRLEAETAGIRKKVGLIFERQGYQRVSGKAQQQQQQASDNQTPTKSTCCVASKHSHVCIPRKPSKWLELYYVNLVLRITESMRIIGINGVISIVKFIRTLSDIRADLRGAGRALVGYLLSDGLWFKFVLKNHAHRWVTAVPGILRQSIPTLAIITLRSRNALQK